MIFSSFLVFFLVKVFLVVLFFCVASVSDLRSHFVSNKIWVVLGPVGVGLSVAECLVTGGSLWLLVGSFVLTVAVAFALFLFLRVGGADAKALMCLGFLFPFFPFTQLLGFPFFIFVVACFFGGVVFVCLNVFKNLVWVCRGWRLFEGCFVFKPWYEKVLAVVFGHRVLLGCVDGLFYLPMQQGFGFTFLPKSDCVGQVESLRRSAEGFVEPYVWAQPSVPLLPFMFLSLLVAFGGIGLV